MGDSNVVQHTDGKGKPLSAKQVQTAMKLQQENQNLEDEFI
jgi:hypothetical protein